MKLARSLEVLEGPDRGRSWPLTRRETVLGRADEAHLKLDDTEASRQHCKIIVKGDTVTVVDLASTNGTWVNGQQVEEAALNTGDLLRIGRTEMRLLTREAAEEGQPGDLTQIKAKMAAAGDLLGRVRGMGFKTRIMAVVGLVCLAGWLLTAWPLVSSQDRVLTEEAMRRGAVLALALAASNREALRLGEEMLVDVKGVAKEDGVVEALVLDRNGRVLAPVGRLHQTPTDERSRRALAADSLLVQQIYPGEYDIAMPIRAFNPASGNFVKVGTARVIFSLAQARGLMLDAWVSALISLIFFLALAGAASYLIVRLANRPLLQLKLDCEAVLKGDLEQAPTPNGFRGAQELAEEMNRLLTKLTQAKPSGAVAGPAPAAPPPPRPPSDQTLQVVADLVGDGILLLDGGHQVLLANHALAEALGAATLSLRGRHLLEVVADKDLLAALLPLLEQARGQAGRPVTAPVTMSDGRQANLAVRVELGPDGEPRLAAMAFRGLPTSPN